MIYSYEYDLQRTAENYLAPYEVEKPKRNKEYDDDFQDQ